MAGLFGRLALLAGIVAALMIGGSGLGHRYGVADVPTAFALMKYGVYTAGGAVVLAVLWLITAIVSRTLTGVFAVVIALLVSGGSAYFPINMQQVAAQVPSIHDITTDTANPPAFVALKSVRELSRNGAEYKTDPAVQLKAYPDLKTFVSSDAPDVLFDKALAVAKALGWEIAAEVKEEGRIEATDTTKWFGFKDDVVIRIVQEGSGSKLDIRSMSRVGISDLGKNASRIREFFAQLNAAK